MWHFRLWDVQDVAVFLSITLYVSPRKKSPSVCVHETAGAISTHSPQRSLTRSVQEDVFFSLEVSCDGTPTIQWTFMSGAVSRTIGTWQPGGYTNITEDYSGRVQAFNNGSMGLSDLRLQDAGHYVVTVTETAGSSKDTGFVLKHQTALVHIQVPGAREETGAQRQGAVRGPAVPLCLSPGSGLCGCSSHAEYLAAGQGLQEDSGMETKEQMPGKETSHISL
ncbi:hypothetical protein KUCAC02_005506 [Chaenocephalus aceratus]|uniref:Uncharacterized protein n=1 Tax=Chaenocephalus aceratus TaxID=36190 RepID=A0ACB9WQ76_CHAAC|nr:hypothetical protein KUCAC02_005506 [Chaenocephalus aceratus]